MKWMHRFITEMTVKSTSFTILESRNFNFIKSDAARNGLTRFFAADILERKYPEKSRNRT